MDQFGEKSGTSTSGVSSSMLMKMMNKNGDNNTNNNMALSFATGNQRVTGAEINIPPDSGTNGNYSKHFYTENNNNNNATTATTSNCSSSAKMRAKIMSHPLFPRLLTAYANCQKVIIIMIMI